MHLAPHIAAVQIKTVAMRIHPRDRLAIELAQKDVGQSFGDRGGSAFEEVGDADVKLSILEANEAIGVGEATELHAQIRQRGTGLEGAKDAGIDFRRRFKKKRSLQA